MFDYSSREKTKFNHRKTGIGMLSRSSEKIKNGQRNNFLDRVEGEFLQLLEA